MTAADLLQQATDQGGECTEIYRWYQGDWDGHLSGLPGTDFDLTDEEGYFLKCANAITYTPGAGAQQQAPSAQPAPVELEALEPVSDPVISDVLVTNRRDVAFSLTWRTDRPSTGWLEYAKDLTGFQNLSGLVAHDGLGEGTASRVHQVTLTGLAPETTYYLRVHSGDSIDDNNGALYQVTTKATELPPVPFLAYGQVQTAVGAPAVGALVQAWLVDAENGEAEPLSTLVDGYGYWSLNLPIEACEGLQLKLEAIGQRGSDVQLIQPACEVQPAVTIKLPAESPTEETTMETYLPMILRGSP